MLSSFRERLENLMPDEYMRPFACKGNPYKCRIFIVGTNPSPKMETPFLANYWSDSKEFFYDEFYASYDAQNPKGRTRFRLEQFVCGAGPIPCLETNIYATPGETLAEDEKNTAIFEFLLREIKPDVIYLYRAPASQYFQNRFDCEVYNDRFTTTNVFGHETHILRSRPSRRFESISYDEVYANGKQCRDMISPHRTS